MVFPSISRIVRFDSRAQSVDSNKKPEENRAQKSKNKQEQQRADDHFQNGGNELRNMGIHVDSLAIIDSLDNCTITLREQVEC